MNRPKPVTICLQCKSYALEYSSLLDLHTCTRCSIDILHPWINAVVAGFSVKKKEPSLIVNYNRIFCVSCDHVGGIYFRLGNILDFVYCEKCDTEINARHFIDAKINAQKTKSLEEIYNCTFPFNGNWRIS